MGSGHVKGCQVSVLQRAGASPRWAAVSGPCCGGGLCHGLAGCQGDCCAASTCRSLTCPPTPRSTPPSLPAQLGQEEWGAWSPNGLQQRGLASLEEDRARSTQSPKASS